MIFVLLLIIVLLMTIIIKPLFKRKFYKIKFLEFSSLNNVKDQIVQSSILMLKAKKTFMSFNEEESLYADLAKIKRIIKGDNSHKNYTFYNFPKAFLLLGLLDQYKESKKESLLIEIIQSIELKYIDETGNLKFDFNKIDQALFGLVFVELYKITKDTKFKHSADIIYQEIQHFKNDEGLYLYRKKDNVLFIDTLGMVVPFLIVYGELLNDKVLIDDAKKQFFWFLNLTNTNQGDFPPHAYDLEHKIKLGSNNWSRGMGWFMIGLAYSTLNDKIQQQLFNQYFEKLKRYRVNSYWPQFFGHSDEYSIDASATIMFYYSANLLGYDVSEDLNTALKNSISVDYFVENNSGDTFYINKYSKIKSKSELSQGLLLSILSKNKK